VDVVDVRQFARNCHRKMLLSLLLYVAFHCPHAYPTSFHKIGGAEPGIDYENGIGAKQKSKRNGVIGTTMENTSDDCSAKSEIFAIGV
jgi:hypothetical protein